MQEYGYSVGWVAKKRGWESVGDIFVVIESMKN